MNYVKNVNPDNVLEIECYRGDDIVCRCYSTDYCDYSSEDLVKLYRSFGLSRRSAEYVVKQFNIWYNRR